MTSLETAPKDSHEIEKPSGSEVVDEFIERHNNLPKKIEDQQKQLELSKKELATFNAEWKSLGGDRIDSAQAAVDALNFKSQGDEIVRARGELKAAKEAFYANMQKQSLEQPGEATADYPDPAQGTLMDTEGNLNPDATSEPTVVDSPAQAPERSAKERTGVYGPYVHGQELVLKNGDSFQKGWIVSEQLSDGGLRLKREFPDNSTGVTSEYRDFSAKDLDDLANIQGQYADFLEDEAYAADAKRDHELSASGRQERRELEDQAYAENARRDNESSPQSPETEQKASEAADRSNRSYAEQVQNEQSGEKPTADTAAKTSNENFAELSQTPQASGAERTDYNSNLAKALDRMASFLSNKSQNLEAKGGIKGIAMRMIKRLGRGAYKYSGLENEVKGMKVTAESVKNIRDMAKERRNNRKQKRAEKREAKQQVREERAEARREQEAIDYQEFLKQRTEAQARKQARKQARTEARNKVVSDAKELGISVKEYLGSGRTARVGRGALNQVRGVYGYIKGAAGAMHRAGSAERQRQMNS